MKEEAKKPGKKNFPTVTNVIQSVEIMSVFRNSQPLSMLISSMQLLLLTAVIRPLIRKTRAPLRDCRVAEQRIK